MDRFTRNRLPVIFILLALLACNRSIRMEIKDYEIKINGCRVKRFIFISEFNPIYGTDSLQWLQAEYDSLYQEKQAELNQQIQEQNKNLNSARKEYDTIANSTMKKVYKPMLDGMEQRIIHLKHIQETYIQNPEHTQFGVISARINYYQLNKTQLLGYWVQVSFTGTEGLLPMKTYQHNYLFDTNKRTLISTTNRVSYRPTVATISSTVMGIRFPNNRQPVLVISKSSSSRMPPKSRYWFTLSKLINSWFIFS